MRLIPYLLISLIFGCCSPSLELPDAYAITVSDGGGSCIPFKVSNGFTYFITCYHVVKGSTDFTIDGEPAELVNINPALDVAILRIKKVKRLIFTISPEKPKELEKVTAIGFPKGVGPVVTEGYVAVRLENGMWICSAPTAPGSSGGPVLDYNTLTMIGMTRAVGTYEFSLITHMHYFVPAYIIREWLIKEGLL